MGTVKLKIYPCYSFQLSDSTYKILKLDAVKKEFILLGDIYATKEECEEEVKTMNIESGPLEYEYDI